MSSLRSRALQSKLLNRPYVHLLSPAPPHFHTSSKRCNRLINIPSVETVSLGSPVGRSVDNRIVARFLKDVSSIGTLFKWKLSVWIALSTLPGYIMATGAAPMSSAFIALAVGTFLCSGGANTFNQISEKDRDALMVRTRSRPLASGRVSTEWAIRVGSVASLSGVGILLAGTNPMTAFLGATNIGLYALVYTPLKVVTPYNTHVGSVVGSIPTVMGCTAAGVSLLTPDPWMLFTIQTLWQFPHFYGLAWRYRLDYIKGGFISFPLSDVSGHETSKMMRPYVLTTAILPFLTAGLDITSLMFIVDGSVANYILWDSFRRFENNPSIQTSRRFFGVSLWHLLVFLTLAVFHSRQTVAEVDKKSVPASQCPWRGSGDSYTLYNRIESLREIVQEFCVHKKLYADKDSCIFDRIGRLAPGFRLEEK